MTASCSTTGGVPAASRHGAEAAGILGPHERAQATSGGEAIPADGGSRSVVLWLAGTEHLRVWGKRLAERQALYAQLVESEEAPPDDRVDPEEYLGILAEAVTRRNGSKAILERCRERPRGLSVAVGDGRRGPESRSLSRIQASGDPT